MNKLKLTFTGVVLLHIILWTLFPILLLSNASLDVVEGLAWGQEWQLGYEKDPPLWPWLTGAAVKWSGNKLWSCYLLAQICVGTVFLAVYRLGKRITTEQDALVAVFLLEGIFFFNFPTPEFNDLVLQLPFAALFGWLLHCAIVEDRTAAWVLSGLVAGLGLLSRYSMGAYIAPMVIFLMLHPLGRCRLRSSGPWLMGFTATLVFLPHLYWIIDSGFISIQYVGRRAPAISSFGNFFIKLLSFLGAQAAAFIPMLLLTVVLWRWKRVGPAQDFDLQAFDRNYLTTLAFGPIAFSLTIAIVTIRPPRDMWGAPLWCFASLFVATWIRPVLTKERWRVFTYAWLGALFFPLLMYWLTHTYGPTLTGRESRTHFPGQQLGSEVTGRWQTKTGKPLRFAIGDTWHAGNVAFYSTDRPSVLFTDGVISFNPWISEDSLKKEGAVLVWDAKHEGSAVPSHLASRFTGAVLQPPISLRGESSSYLIGMAILLPRTTVEDIQKNRAL